MSVGFGSIIFTKAFRNSFINPEKRVTGTVSYKASKGQVFVLLLLGALPEKEIGDTAKMQDYVKFALHELGWYDDYEEYDGGVLMSLYNQMMGYDPLAPTVLRLLGINRQDVPRFRDATVVEIEGEARLAILTRTGGVNRPEWVDLNAKLRAHPNFIRDYDAPEDTTFAMFEFAPSNGVMQGLVRGFVTQRKDNRPPMTRFVDLIDRLSSKEHENDSDVRRAREVGEQIIAAMFSGGGHIVEVAQPPFPPDN